VSDQNLNSSKQILHMSNWNDRTTLNKWHESKLIEDTIIRNKVKLSSNNQHIHSKMTRIKIKMRRLHRNDTRVWINWLWDIMSNRQNADQTDKMPTDKMPTKQTKCRRTKCRPNRQNADQTDKIQAIVRHFVCSTLCLHTE